MKLVKMRPSWSREDPKSVMIKMGKSGHRSAQKENANIKVEIG